MPGIVGLITKKPRAWAERQLACMLETMQHESFYNSRTWVDENLGIYIGWTARENSFSDVGPICNEREDVVLVFSGEDYPEAGAVEMLKSAGHVFEHTGPSYLVHLYEEDQNFPKSLNGRFQGLLADRRTGKVLLFNDRFGLQRVYFHEAKDAFYFSAEAKAVLAVRPELRTIDAQGLGEYIGCGCVLENRTLFQGIFSLPPASAWTFRAGVLDKKGFYFESREWEELEPLDDDGYYAELRGALKGTLEGYFRGREKIGISLTGGLDTRVIMAWHKAESGTFPGYTFGSMYRENQDVYLARRVAKVCNQPYHLVTVGREVVEGFPQYAERTLYLTDGCVDVARSLDLYNNKMARQIAPVRMVGTFGSEIIRSAVMFKHVAPEEDVFQPDVMASVSRGGETYRRLRNGHATSFVAFGQTSAYHYGVLALEQSQLTMRTPFLDNKIVRAVFRSPKVGTKGDVRLRLIREGCPELARLRTDRGFGDYNPLLAAIAHAYLEFTFKAEYAYDYGMPQWVARADHMFAPLHLERLWLGRHKLFHFRIWYRTILANYVREMLLDRESLSRPYLKKNVVEAIVNAHLRGNRNYTVEIHRLLSLELLHRLFVDSRNVELLVAASISA